MQVISIVFFAGTIIVFTVFQLLNAQKYKEFIAPLDNKEYSYKAFLPGCLGIVDLLGITGVGRYQTRLSHKISMVYGNRYLAYYTKVHWACKVFHLLLGIILGALYCILGEIDYIGILIIPAFGVLLFFLADKGLDDKFRERRFQLERDFPDFLSKLVLLVNAGLNVRQAIERIATETNSTSPLYMELQNVISDIRAGMSESEAYSEFSQRCKLKQISNFVSILQQNIKLGGNQMLFELRRMHTECWEMRKSVAKQLGEKASSKLMFPLALMLIAILLICVAPVVIELRGGF